MATIDIKQGTIKDRTVGYKPISYGVGNKSTKFLQACLRAHETIIGVLTPQARSTITPQEVKSAVLGYVALDEAGKKELLKKIALSGYGNTKSESVSLERLADVWLEQKSAKGVTDKYKAIMRSQRNSIAAFFNSFGLRTTSDLNPDVAFKFLKWRSETNFLHPDKPVSASIQRHELQVLKQMAKIAARNDWISKSDIWEDAEVKSIAGVNVKVVEPLSIDLQKKILGYLKNGNPEFHDVVLLLLLTGMRKGELAHLKPGSIAGNAIALHGEAIGTMKPGTGKTAAAARVLPVCPTMQEIFKRGFIFKANIKYISRNMARTGFAKNFPNIHPHRLRHTFAVNKLLSQTATLQMVSYQLGHSDIGTTANLYGKFVPEHFKAGFEEAIKERRELVEWLEQGYFQ